MASDSRTGLRAEINEALAVLKPLIRGLETLRTSPSLTAETKTEVDGELAEEKALRTAEDNVIKALDSLDAAVAALEALGYPVDPKELVSPAVMAELQAELAAISQAVSEFIEEPTLKVSFGDPIPKAQ